MEKENLSNGVLPLKGCNPLSTLYVIGNGFDVAHGIKSRYNDFRNFEKKKNNGRFVNLMDIFFSNQTDFWCDIETALGQYDENSIIDFCNPEEEFDLDHPTRSEAAYADSPDSIFYPLLDELKNEFSNWVDNININGIKKIKKLQDYAKYLTFNYTDTLETIYGIPLQQVCHIHGLRKRDHEYIIGHSNLRNPDEPFDNDDIYFKQETRAKVIGWMNHMYKNTSIIISQNNVFFNSLANIRQIIVLGHSLNDVDLPYFDKIIQATGKNTLWKFSFYNTKDIERINKFIDKTGLTNTKTIHFDELCTL